MAQRTGRAASDRWLRVALILIALFLIVSVVSFVLHLLRLIVYAAAVVIAIVVVRRAMRGPR
jgi:hypothetical protein